MLQSVCNVSVSFDRRQVLLKVLSYIARYPVHRTAQNALHFTPWQTCSFQGHLNFFGKYSATLKLLFVHISTTVCIARYSFIQLSELWQRGVIKLAKGSKRPQWDLRVRPSNRYAIAPHKGSHGNNIHEHHKVFVI